MVAPLDETFTVFKVDTPCPWCDKAVELLQHVGAEWTVLVMDRSTRKIMKNATGMNTVPIIQYGTAFIGGFEDLQKFLKSEGLLD